MLEQLLDDYSMSFGTRNEKLEKESAIKQIEQLNRESSVLSKDYDSLRLPYDFSVMEVSEGELPSYDQMPGSREDGINIRRSQLQGNKGWNADANMKTISSQAPDGELDVGRRKTGTNLDITNPKKTKRSLRYHGRRHHYWRPRHHFSPYYNFPEEPFDPIPSIPHFIDFPRFPTPKRLPKFPLSLMAERFVPYPHLPKIDEYFPPSLEELERLPEPPPIPKAILDREETGTRDPEPVDDLAPLPEPVPAPEPPPILEPPPIPELAPIKEIPPIKEPEEKTPPNLDPKKTFGTGESNGGVKKSSSEGKNSISTTGLPTSI